MEKLALGPKIKHDKAMGKRKGAVPNNPDKQ